MLACLVFGRILILFVCVGLINMCRTKEQRASFKDGLVFWWGGIVRGSICFALSLKGNTNHTPVIVTSTFTIVIVTTFVIGSFTDTFLRAINMKNSPVLSIFLVSFFVFVLFFSCFCFFLFVYYKYLSHCCLLFFQFFLRF